MSEATTHSADNASEAQFLAPEPSQNADHDRASMDFEVVDDQPFFAPAPTGVLDRLIGEYQAARANIERLAAIVMGGEFGNVVAYFIEGNAGDERMHRSLYVDKLFAVPGAIGALNAAYWSKALALTDVYACMPQERKNRWDKQLKHPEGLKTARARWSEEPLAEWESEPLPDFEGTTVRNTIDTLLRERSLYLAERVDGLFRALSGSHVTNTPEGFGKRMIVACVLGSYGYPDHSRVGYLHDLRCVIAKFMGRDEPLHSGATSDLVTTARNRHGKWVYADGGALKLRVYKVGTAHLEVHPDMAWRLNAVLAGMHPLAIPAEFRRKPTKRPKDFAMIDRPLPFAVLAVLARMRQALEFSDAGRDRTRRVPNTLAFDSSSIDKVVLADATRAIEAIGGIRTGAHFTFEFDPAAVMSELLTTGCIPDVVSHQFYPTPVAVGHVAIEMADIGDAGSVLEPQAGNGDLAALLPAERTLCVEISPLRCSVLKARGFNTLQADFLEWASTTSKRFDRVVMNPPFSEGRWKQHTDAAATLLSAGGRLVAILPASARSSYEVAGCRCTWSRPIADAFAGTSVSVVILTADRTS